MTKKELKTYFKAISDGELTRVTQLLDENPEYLNLCNFAPPKKDDGQSGLQLAFKTGQFGIAKLLIDRGTDVNFQETSTINEWTTPVLHDCIRATIFNCYTLQQDTSKFDNAFNLLRLMLEKKANVNATDSYGNSCLGRAIMDARQMIDNPRAELQNGILLQQLRKVFKALIDAGADPDAVNATRDSAKSDLVNFRLESYQIF
jgi:ankyrin repeat protein